MSTSRPTQLKTEFDMDSFFDFNQSTNASPATATAHSASPYDQEERQQFNGPSHDYAQFKQQVGLPVGTLSSMPLNPMYDGFNSGVEDMGFNSGFGYNSGLDFDGDMGMEFGGNMPMSQNDSDNFINPNSVGGHEEPPSNVGRLWPGMHSQQAQQAAMQKAAQAQAVQQRQRNLQAQQAQYRQAANTSQSQSSQGSSQAHGKRATHVEPHVEESISRLLNQMRQSTSGLDDAGSPGSVLPHIARMKKDEEEMDEDERLLASDEGKKLSSKERRQLRNKVSARAFRSRRKEYISQLEGEVAMKTQEFNNMRQENQALMHENERYRGLIETLLRHPAFTPFINDISKDPSSLMLAPQQPQQQHQQSVTPTPQPAPAQPQQPQQQQQSQQEIKPEYMNFDASQLQVPSQSQPEQHQVGMAMVPENDFSKLNINGFNAMNFNFNSVNAYAVTDIPCPDPIDLLYDSSNSACSSDMTNLLAKLDNAARNLDHLDHNAA